MNIINETSFQLRSEENLKQLKKIYDDIYNSNSYWKRLVDLMKISALQRPIYLQEMDINDFNWYVEEDVIGMTFYVDLFAVDVKGIKDKIPYLKELGITFIHFMPLLESREGQNDGGYAVKNYKELEPSLGTMKEFQELIELLGANGIKVCIDFVVNHTAKEHEWAVRAARGEKKYQKMYLMYDTDEIPRLFEQTVPEVFPKVSPGNFTYYESFHKWVFTSFYEFQWDLNFQNPYVFEQIIDILLFLANKGINAIRLDAIPFMWKTVGTNCRNLPEIHKLLEMMHLIAKIVCPSVILLGEAIVEPEEIIKYFGVEQVECQQMYNATYMVNIWNALATKDIRLLKIDQDRLQVPPWGTWINYIRCHDDIGWGFNEEAIRNFGFSPEAHKQFLINFYEGVFPESFSTGELYEFNPQTLDARNSGTLASLCGLEKAIKGKDRYQLELAHKRIQLIYGLLLASSGIPLIYSGDEIAAMNDYNYKNEPSKAHDSRWLHRSRFDWDQAEKRNDLSTSEGIIFNCIKELIKTRKMQPIFNSTIRVKTIETTNKSVFSFYKVKDDKTFIGIFNFSEDRQAIDTKVFTNQGLAFTMKDLIQGKTIESSSEKILVGPYEFLWLM
ncbi:MAG: alpha-amylase [Firmicutes bacterium HGW-Firmicutes-1]|jgi:glycosidase|nr:MAG: alpha-amylase [Firmicutes bacterium HGW-Firmicutes-1]